MNIGNEQATQGHLGVGRDSHTSVVKTLRPEEVKMYKECSFGLYFKAGLPFAVVCHFLSTYLRKQKAVEITSQVLVKRGFIFLGNVVLGTLLFSPICYNKLVAMRTEFEKNNKNLKEQEITRVEGSQPVTQTEDFSYPTDVVSNLIEPESSFSSDFNASKLLTDDVEDIKTQSTTYQDLRAQHRSAYAGSRGLPSNLQPELGLGSYSAPVEKPMYNESPEPKKIVRKNKYGDEIE